MKKNVFFAAVALVALAGCTNDERIGGEVISPDNPQAEQGAIVFSTVSKGITRADHVGADAANLLNKKFIVSGFKGAGPVTATEVATGKVFDNYTVEWSQNTAATTESNTSDWEYVGKTPAPTATVKGTQTIKYWDYSAAQYDFIAYSTGTASAIKDGTPTAGQIVVSAITPATATTSAYTLKGAVDDLAKCYIADMVTVAKDGYGKEVQLSFRSLATKIRVALYETIPGYSVKDVKFYTDNATSIGTGTSVTNATLFIPSGEVGFGSAGTYTISFPTIGTSNSTSADYNKAHVAFSADAGSTANANKEFGALNYTTAERNEGTGNNYLGRTSRTASFAGTSSPYYATVLPNPTGAVLELRVDYTLVSIDGSGETIKIRGAKAFVPANYTHWLPNYAYTYIFKISDNTNGWTSTVDTDPAGLYPITFDAVVADSEDGSQSTITTVATPSITTYQKGHDITKDEYAASDGDIYVQVITDGTLNDLSAKGQLYKLSELKTEAEVMDALNIQSSSTETTITGRNGLTLTKAESIATITAIPGVDGNDIEVTTTGTAAKFTPAAGQTYAYVYDATPTPDPAATYYYSANVLTEAPSDWSTPNLWYKDPDGNTLVDATYTNGTYYKKYTNQNKVYGVKVIKIAAAAAPTPEP